MKEEYLKNPFEIPLEEYRALSSEEYYMLVKRLYSNYGEWIRSKFRETKARCIVVCDGKVVHVSDDEYGPPDEVVNEIENRVGKPCYILTRAPLIEESSRWSDLGNEDYYPTLTIHIGKANWDNEKVFREGVKIDCDFDTGNPEYVVIDERICRTIEGESRRRRVREHLGVPYTFFPCSMKVGVTDGEKGRCLEKVVECVENWDDLEKNPYKIANPKREGFAGRDLMLKLFFRITLDPSLKRSSWQLR
ncbi:MAG: hypothetical protein QXY99_07640 [Thermoproteota archaeon]